MVKWGVQAPLVEIVGGANGPPGPPVPPPLMIGPTRLLGPGWCSLFALPYLTSPVYLERVTISTAVIISK